MNCLSSLVVAPIPSEATSAQQKSYVTYALSYLALQVKGGKRVQTNGNHDTAHQPSSRTVPTITLLENHYLLTPSGTTGHRTWESAFHLGNYLCAHPTLISQKSVLELGAGTGYLSVLCSRYLSASRVLSTDGSSDVVATLSTNFYLKNLQESSKSEAKELLWVQALVGSEHPEWNLERKVDLVIGVDVTYDFHDTPALVATFSDLFSLYSDLKILIATTARNEETFEKFVDICSKRNFSVEEIEWPALGRWEQEGPFYEVRDPMKLLMITKS